MVFKTCAPVLILCALGLAQSQVSLSGTVKSSRSGSPLAGADVRLAGSSLATTTAADGSFQLTGATGVSHRERRIETRSGLEGQGIPHRQIVDGPVVLRVFDLAGVQSAVLQLGTLPQGDWIVTVPARTEGLQILSIEAPGSRRSYRLLAGVGSPRRNHDLAITPTDRPTTETVRAARGAATEALDTLVVSHDGYVPVRMPLSSRQQSGLSLLLEDSATGNVDQATLVPDPSWPCYMPEGIPPPHLGKPVFVLNLRIGAIHEVGATRFGRRRQYDIGGGSVSGDRISATVEKGGLDYDLTLRNGAKEIEQIVILKAGSVPILMRNAGLAPTGAEHARMVLDFEAPNSSSYTWLNTGKFAAVRVVDTIAKTIRMEVYDISQTIPPKDRIVLQDPSGAEHQSWDCPVQTGGQGASVLTETVTLGSSISIGASKRGSRNIIPITGGTTKGRVVGKILDGGADYQLGGLDARYTLAPDDGELVIVRNCGSGTLYPVFEARVDGPYAFLNQNKYVSSSPSMVNGGVSITFYEKK